MHHAKGRFGKKLRCGLPTRLPSWPPSETTGTDRVGKEQRANMTNDDSGSDWLLVLVLPLLRPSIFLPQRQI